MTKPQTSICPWNKLTWVMVLAVAAAASLSGCGDDAAKTTPQTEYPADYKAADQAQIDFLKSQSKSKKK